MNSSFYYPKILVKDEVREARGVGALDDLRADLGVAMRVWARRPAFALVVIATLALGIGANVAIVSVIDGVLLKPLPSPEPGRLGVIYTELPRQGRARPAVDAGFDTHTVQTVKLSLVDSHSPYSESARIGECYRQWVEQLAGVSGIEMAGATSQLPLDGNALDLGS
ncbi:MAG: hypothetical protein VX427_08685 [Acidobacteriota bacterium]|nr:hypothetical protein [Acidobacteriota bacterium]